MDYSSIGKTTNEWAQLGFYFMLIAVLAVLIYVAFNNSGIPIIHNFDFSGLSESFAPGRAPMSSTPMWKLFK